MPSIEIPIARAATIAVPAFSGYPSSAIATNTSAIVTMPGTSAISPPLIEVNISDVARTIAARRMRTVSTWPARRRSAAASIIRPCPVTALAMSGPAMWRTTWRSSSTCRLSVVESLTSWRTTMLARRKSALT